MKDDGYRTWEVLKQLGIGFNDGTFNAIHTFPGGLSYYDVETAYFDAYDPTDVRRVQPLIDRALSGDWHATGRRKVGDDKLPLKREVIRSEFWEFLQVDVIADSASGGGIEFVGLRWHLCPPPEREKKTIVAKKECIGWLFEIMKHPRTTTVPQLQSEAQHKFPDLSARTFRRALSEVKGKNTIHPSWRKSGPLSS